MKKVYSIYIIGSYPPPFGGVSVHIKSLFHYIKKQEKYACFIFNSGKNKDINEEGIINIKNWKDLAIKLFQANADIFHLHGGAESYKKMLLLYIFRILLGKRWMATLHSGAVVKNIEESGWLAKRVLSIIFNSSEYIVCVSEKIRDALVNISVKEDKLKVIPAFSIDEEIGKVELDNELQEFFYRHNPVFACLGYSYEYHYGYELAIHAANNVKKEFPTTGLIIMGGDKSKEDYKNLTAKFNKDELCSVLLTGDVNHDTALSVILKCSIFLRPTYHDGDSVSVREAIAMKVPVIASDTEIRPTEAVLFNRGDLEDLTAKIKENLYSQKTVNSREAGNKVSNNKNLEHIFSLYENILAK